MKIIITGASGFVGTSYIKNNKNHRIEPVCLIQHKLEELNFTGSHAVLHLAALVHQMKGAPESEYFKINSDLAIETALKAKKEGVKHFVFMSTIKVYGESTTDKPPFNEKSECIPEDPYGKSKLEAEKRIASLEDDNFKVAIIRSPLVYGPGVKANMYNLIKLIDKLPLLPLGNIKNKRSFVYIDNLTALIDCIITLGASGIYIARDSRNISTTDLVLMIAASLNKKRYNIPMPWIFRKILAGIFPSQFDRLWGSLAVSPEEGWSRSNYTPPVSIENGIDEMVKWYLEVKGLGYYL